MSVSRRRFLQHGALAAAACVAVPLEAWGGRQTSIDGNPSGLDSRKSTNHGLTRAAFAGLVGASFKVTGAPGASPVWVRLSSVDDPPALAPVNTGMMAVSPKSSAAPISTTGYLVSFSGPGTSLDQGTYTFENDQLGSFSLFIVPGALGTGTYTAVFNLLNTPAQGPGSIDHPIRMNRIGPGDDGTPGNPGALNNSAPSVSSTPVSSTPFSSTPGLSGAAGNTGNSGAGRPAQEDLEPSLRERLKFQLPE